MYRQGQFLKTITTMLLFTVLLSSAANAQSTGNDSDKIPINSQLQINIDIIDLDYLREVVKETKPTETLKLSVADCVKMALESNQDIVVAEFEPLKSDGDILSSHGTFDPYLSSNVTYSHAEQNDMAVSLTTGALKDAKQWSTTSTTSLSGILEYGTQYNLSLDVAKSESTASQYVEYWNTNLALTLTQPLLRGRGKILNRTYIKFAENNRASTVSQLRMTALTSVADTLRAYWDLVAALEFVRVREQSLANAERLLTISEKRFEIGNAAAIEVLQAKAGVAMRQSELIGARSSVRNAEDALKRLISLRDGNVFSKSKIEPVDQPNVPDFNMGEVTDVDSLISKSVDLAMEHRPEIHMSEYTITNADLDENLARNELLPQFDIVAGYSQGGYDHFMSRSFTNLRDKDSDSYTIGFMGTIPLGNRAARGRHIRAKHTMKQTRFQLEKVKQDIIFQVQLAARNVATSRILVESNMQTRKLQEVNVVAEEKRLQLGTTTSYRVLQIEGDLTAAQMQEVQARTNYERARVDLQFAEGTLLQNLGVDFEEPEKEPSMTFIKSINPFD